MPGEEPLQFAIEDLREARWRMQRDLFDDFPAPRQCEAALLASGIDRQNQRHYGSSVNARSIA